MQKPTTAPVSEPEQPPAQAGSQMVPLRSDYALAEESFGGARAAGSRRWTGAAALARFTPRIPRPAGGRQPSAKDQPRKGGWKSGFKDTDIAEVMASAHR